jgi:hypothetical protein
MISYEWKSVGYELVQNGRNIKKDEKCMSMGMYV